MRRQAGDSQGGGHGGCAREAGHLHPGLEGGTYEPIAGIAHERRSGIGHQGHVFARHQARDQLAGPALLVVIVVADRRRLDTVPPRQGSEVPRILGGHHADRAEGGDGAQGEVVGISDRNGHDEESPAHAEMPSMAWSVPVAAWSPAVGHGRSYDLDVPGLIECVPNFSEGRRGDVVEQIVHAVASIDGVTVLDHTRDVTHNRSVITFAGSAEPVVRAATAAVGRALELIDMSQHQGAHPRIGAVDVIPFVPLGLTRIEECVDLARRFGEQIASRFDIPVYLYGDAALRPERQRLAEVRRGQYEAIRDEIATVPHRAPDFGPLRVHPRGGAVAVGARKPLIAFNVNLRTDDLAVAIKIAHQIRESSGGMPAVQAMGILLENPGRPPMAQVSTNLVDWERTGIAQVVGEVRRLAREAGTDIDHCELIGLAPTGALLEVAADALGLADFSVDQALELRLARDR